MAMENPSLHHHAIYRSKSTGTMQHVSRRLSSGSACETCRRRKTKCDGGQPCAFCATNRIDCVHRPSRRKRATPYPTNSILFTSSTPSSPCVPPSSSTSPDRWSSCSPLTKHSSFPSLLSATQPPIPSLTDQLSCRTFSVVSLADHKKTFAASPY
ncbi:hypothetical protein DM01DRAFT_1386360 [Hesseltinella vesiculosa]|uniref:Zn(2)-C6 fungal-type domain-containing protein n=1 Tax=Hesseltinella vesiculosa TaxID=101127 RepID=A0A1X2G681_9FUNG|nr:hypothetical protein DM01DRAFT_1386360 [Hesseltinella vesiculosa]